MSKKAQVVLSDYEYCLAEEEARAQGKSVSSLLREALAIFLDEIDRRGKDEALKGIMSLNEPVDDWPVIEEEILKAQDDAVEDWQLGEK